tara:strand:- start:412 stop:735 length:324 start_codon:yes stop_codon:yes gene_type:complete
MSERRVSAVVLYYAPNANSSSVCRVSSELHSFTVVLLEKENLTGLLAYQDLTMSILLRQGNFPRGNVGKGSLFQESKRKEWGLRNAEKKGGSISLARDGGRCRCRWC